MAAAGLPGIAVMGGPPVVSSTACLVTLHHREVVCPVHMYVPVAVAVAVLTVRGIARAVVGVAVDRAVLPAAAVVDVWLYASVSLAALGGAVRAPVSFHVPCAMVLFWALLVSR